MKFIDFFIPQEYLDEFDRRAQARTLIIASIGFACFGDLLFFFRVDPQNFSPLGVSIFLFFLILLHLTPFALRWSGSLGFLSWIIPIAGPVMTCIMPMVNGGINAPLIIAAPMYCFVSVLLLGPKAGFLCSVIEALLLVGIGSLQIHDPNILPKPLLSPDRVLISRTIGTGVVLIVMGTIAAFYEQNRRNAQEQLRNNEKRYQYALQNAHEGVFDWNIENNTTYFSPLFKTLLHYEADASLSGEPFPDDCVHPDDLKGLRLAIERASKHTRIPLSIECRLITTSQTSRWFHIQARLQRPNNTRHLIGSIRDITERKQNEALQEEFISTVGHELRTPLTSIIGSLKIINSSVLDTNPTKRNEVTQLAERNALRLLGMVNDFLDWQTISQQTFSLNPQRITFNDLIQEVVALNRGLEERYETKLVTQIPDIPVRIVLDSLRISQVLTNLISNAAKFSPKDSPVTISLQTDGIRAIVCIEDHGPGIPEEFQDTIFDRFQQANPRISDSNAKGTGLGLAICKSIIELHEGEIWFQTSSEGTQFFFSLNLPTHTTHHGIV